jgi:hypothetical protein
MRIAVIADIADPAAASVRAFWRPNCVGSCTSENQRKP